MEQGKELGMNTRLEELLASYGADRSRWPEAERNTIEPGTPEAEAEAREIDALLALVGVPAVPEGAEQRLMRAIGSEAPATVIAFRPKPRAAMQFRHLAAALPLAASLALGIYLGAKGSLDFVLPSAVTGSVVAVDDSSDDLGGVGEADAYAEENLT